jgi:hypothetical protein
MMDSANLISAPELKREGRNGISFSALREGRCKFPLGSIDEPPTRFCGEPTSMGEPYCPDCGRIAYVPSSRRRDRRNPCTLELRRNSSHCKESRCDTSYRLFDPILPCHFAESPEVRKHGRPRSRAGDALEMTGVPLLSLGISLCLRAAARARHEQFRWLERNHSTGGDDRLDIGFWVSADPFVLRSDLENSEGAKLYGLPA